MDRKIFISLLAVIFIYVAEPLLVPVAMGGVLAVLFVPLLERLEAKKVPTSAGSVLLTFAITLLILIPTAFLIFIGTKTAFEQLQNWRNSPAPGSGDWEAMITNMPRIRGLLVWVTRWFPVEMQSLVQSVQDLTRSLGIKLAELLAGFLTHLPGLTMALVVIIVSVYFFLVDGRRLVYFVRNQSIFNEAQTERLLSALAGMCRSVILASVASGFVQSVFESLVCLFTGTPNVALIGLLVFMGSFIPVVGSAPITIGVAAHQLLLGRTTVGLILLGAAGIVSLLDNLIRPIFLKGTTNLHPLIAFVAAFGGLQAFGFFGVFLGPIIAALFVTTLQIFSRGR